MEKDYTVYIHTNKINKKCYIGITNRDAEKRWENGKGYLGTKKNGEFNQPKFANAILKYGWENFEHIIWATGLSKEEACRAEQLLISLWDSIDNGYNVLKGGQVGRLGLKDSEEVKQKKSEAVKQSWYSGKRDSLRKKFATREYKKYLASCRKYKNSFMAIDDLDF